ncbi:MAG TPA: lipoprotein insertase outer membrane protein LolB [Casimicrobiaceae bacterium]|nr:lipoprotein insertase outer membrane protein LolB [Casimicrobiaceae bacterium]
MSARALAASLVAALLALVGCAELPRTTGSAAPDAAALAAPFEIEGRLSARRGNEGVAGQFVWSHEGSRDHIAFASPLGQSIAQLAGDANGVRVEMSGGRVETAPAWDALTARTLGFPLPVAGLAAWLRGLPREGSPNRLERDGAGRPIVLTQDGWEVAYAYADDAATRPLRLTLRYPATEPIELRVVVDRWQ